MAEPKTRPRLYFTVFAALLVLTIVTVFVARINLGPFNVVVALSVAFVKALLVVLYFMHLRYGPRLTWIVAAGGLYWLGILLVLTMSDYLTREWTSR
jgi:cytochrome c oxidase subunit 4